MCIRNCCILIAFSVVGAIIVADDQAVSDADIAGWVDKRVEAWQPTKAERRFDEIGWITDIREAERLAKQHNRPVFLFTHDGHMAVGRC
jgi:hypothetical protein